MYVCIDCGLRTFVCGKGFCGLVSHSSRYDPIRGTPAAKHFAQIGDEELGRLVRRKVAAHWMFPFENNIACAPHPTIDEESANIRQRNSQAIDDVPAGKIDQLSREEREA